MEKMNLQIIIHGKKNNLFVEYYSLSLLCLFPFPIDTSDECPPNVPGTVGICVEECSGNDDCPLDLVCCSNGCGHTCQQKYIPGRLSMIRVRAVHQPHYTEC